MSLTWNPVSRRYVGDARLVLVLGRALLLQVGHPVVAAGVAEHSRFQTDPWGRFEGTVGKLMATTYGPDPAAVTREIRELHKRIKGIDAQGNRYHSLEPEAYFWVLATTLESIVEMARRFARPMSAHELAAFYDEQREQARMLGVRDRDMPATWAAFERYFTEMLHTRIENSDVVHQVVEQLAHPARPPQLALPPLAWHAIGPLSGHLLQITNVGTLPPIARERWGIDWSWHQEQQLRLIGRAARSAMSALPPQRRLLPQVTQAEYAPAEAA